MANEKVHVGGSSIAPLSFSLNSLDGCADNTCFDTTTSSALTQITTNSLNRRPKRKANRETMRRSWGPKDKEEGNKDFWASIQEPYDFIMGTNLMPDSCQSNGRSELSNHSADLELSWDFDDVSPSYGWNLTQFLDQYNELYEWLIDIQVNSQHALASTEARLANEEELHSKAYRKKVFVEQGTYVAQKCPGHAEEISWRVGYLQNKWHQLEMAFKPTQPCKPHAHVQLDIEHEETVVKRWLETMEDRIQPITCRLPKGCSLHTLQERFKDNQILVKDIEAHGPIVKSILRHYETPLDTFHTSTPATTPRAPRRARSLEKRWHQIYLRSLEWHYYLEGVLQNFKECVAASCSSDSDGEPLAKCRRISCSQSSVASDSRKQRPATDYHSNLSDNGSYIEDDWVGAGNDSLELPSQIEMVTESPSLPNAHAPTTPSDNQCQLTAMQMTSPNSGVYHFKHHDTDCEDLHHHLSPPTVHNQLIGMESVRNRTRTAFEYDEDEQERVLQHIIDSAIPDPDWRLNGNITDSEASDVQAATAAVDRMDTASDDYTTDDKQSITQLISGAEKLVKDKNAGVRGSLQLLLLSGPDNTKQQRLRQWLCAQKSLCATATAQDSCDASGELTTGESDCESNASNGQKTPLLPPSSFSPTKVVLRGKKRRQNQQRPWSVTELNQLSVAENPQELRFLRHCLGASSVVLGSTSARRALCSSESALNHMQTASLDASHRATASLKSLMNSQSTLKDTSESEALTPGHKTDCTPCEESPSTTVMDSAAGHQLYRSPSSAVGRKRKSKLRRKSYQSLTRRTATDSGSEGRLNGCESERSLPLHRRSFTKSLSCASDDVIGSVAAMTDQHAAVVVEVAETTVPVVVGGPVADPAPVARSFVLGPCPARELDVVATHEEFSSLSEQAWDPYQDQKYLSEPYSEDIDQEAVRRLLDFGDDYHQYIDSDASSLTGVRRRRRAPTTANTTDLDSEAEMDSLRQVIEQSHSQLAINVNILHKYANGTPLGIDLQAEVVSTARTNLQCLRQFMQALHKEGPSLQPQLKQVQGLIEKWQSLQTEAESRQRQVCELRQLHKLIESLRDSLQTVSDDCQTLSVLGQHDSPQLLAQKLNTANELVRSLSSKRDELTALNVNIHRYLTDSQATPPCLLKDQLTDLYQLWDATQNKANEEVSRIEAAQATWILWQQEKARLQEELKQDSDTLKVLDEAMQTGDLTEAMTSSAEDVSRLLNQRRKHNMAAASSSSSTEPNKAMGHRRDGNVSDSGTSGYESCSSDDLSERERRLAHLKKLATQLEATLQPGSDAWTQIINVISDAENELQSLQQQCRQLLVRSAPTLDQAAPLLLHPFNNTSRRRTWSRNVKNGGGRRDGRLWAWRVVKAAIPFQAALLLLLCVACLLEPNCCDAVNTLNRNFNPQLRFVYGPPPI